MSRTTLFLIRHAQAVVNVQPILGGMRGDTGLTPYGVTQAQRLAERLATRREIVADHFFASTLPRARQTAEIIAPALGQELELSDELQELRVGPEADGLTMDEYVRRFGWVELAAEPFRTVDPGGESWAEFSLRVARTLDRIVREHAGKTICVVTHGGVIDGSFGHFFGLSPHALPPVRFDTINTSITEWQQEERKGRLIWRLARYNDCHHLDGLGPAPEGETDDTSPQSLAEETTQ
jgi:probable phosphoglycerate mutase